MDIDDLSSRHHLDEAYLKKLGFAFYAFSSAESNAIWCCNRLVPGFQASWTRKDWAPAKKLATKLKHEAVSAIKLRDDPEYKKNLKELGSYSDRFLKLADEERNKLFHALPVGDNGKTVLHKISTTFREAELENFINEALKCRSYFNAAFHGFLKDNFEQDE